MRIALSLSGVHISGEAKMGKFRGDCRSIINSLKAIGKCDNPSMKGVALSIKGPRPNNEDSATVAIKRIDNNYLGMLAVADGVGGKEKGEVASAAAICQLLHLFANVDEITEEWITGSFNHIHEIVRKKAAGGATTLSVGIVDVARGVVWSANVGDSPIYLINHGGVIDLTPDRDEYDRYITQALGDRTYRGPHVLKMPLRGFALVGVTDGVDDFVTRDKSIYFKTLNVNSPLQYACALLNHVKTKTRDNATVAALFIYKNFKNVRNI